MKSKKITVSSAKKKTWKVFSLYIRTRDCVATTGHREEGKCVTCKKVFPIKSLQAGHFIPGRHPSVLFDERNCHAQCMQCNVYKRGNMVAYYKVMLERYGQDVIYELEKKDLTLYKFTVDELQEMFNTYTRKVYEI